MTAAGIYIDTLTNSIGCDSIITVNLSRKNNTTATFTTAVCAGNSYVLPSGKSVQAGATYSDTIPNAAGCDSLISITINALQAVSTSQTANICLGETYRLPNGSFTGIEGLYRDTLQTIGGCDSLISINLYVHPVYDIVKQDSIYSGDLYTLPNGSTTAIEGNYINTLQTVNGCDSVITIVLKVIDTTTLTGIRNNIYATPLLFGISNHHLNIQNKLNVRVTELAIYNSGGALVSFFENPDNNILLPELPKDVYIIRAIINNREPQTVKLVIYE